jgi:hypothetical protein
VILSFRTPKSPHTFFEVGTTLLNTTQRFLEVLRLYYNQYLLPDRPVLNWSIGHWLLSDNAMLDRVNTTSEGADRQIVRSVSGYHYLPEEQIREMSSPFLNRLFTNNTGHIRRYNTPSVSVSAWPEISRRITETTKPNLSEVLIATAFGECEPHLGNPRLGLIEAVVALEIEVKTLMRLSLGKYGISNSAIDRIVRETPLADLTSVWIQREIPEGAEKVPQEIFVKCATAIRERNELIHHSRRNISPQRAQEHIKAIAQLVEKIRQIRHDSFSSSED